MTGRIDNDSNPWLQAHRSPRFEPRRKSKFPSVSWTFFYPLSYVQPASGGLSRRARTIARIASDQRAFLLRCSNVSWIERPAQAGVLLINHIAPGRRTLAPYFGKPYQSRTPIDVDFRKSAASFGYRSQTGPWYCCKVGLASEPPDAQSAVCSLVPLV